MNTQEMKWYRIKCDFYPNIDGTRTAHQQTKMSIRTISLARAFTIASNRAKDVWPKYKLSPIIEWWEE